MKKLTLIAALFAGFFCSELLQAQNSGFQLANRMMQQQNYEEALPILQRLHEENPEANIFFDRLIDCLVNLKEYEEASGLIERRMDSGHSSNQLLIRKGEILHSKGDQESAFEIWDQVIEDNYRNMQLYYQVGNTLINRREFARAADFYLKARDEFGESTLFINEVANAHMQAGNFANAMNEYFKLIRTNPNQMNFVQQRLLRMNDTQLYETAALEIEDHIVEMDINHPAYNQMHQLYTWLLIETEQFRRALVAARQYESRTEVLNYSLYALAEKLLSNNEFELAAEAYQYYTDSTNQSVINRAKDREAEVYHAWADYLSDHNLEDLQLRNELFHKSYQLGADLLEEAPYYEQRDRVMVRLAELSLDVFYDKGQALHWIEKIEEEISNNNHAKLFYLRGRLALFNQNYTEARQALTRANRNAEDSELAEKSRYFLSLTDFFSGDFDFALLQLRSLERRNVSYYANNALKLRMWIQQGKRADTTGAALKEYANVIETLFSGETAQALSKFKDILDDAGNPLIDNGLVEISSHGDVRHIPILYTMVKSVNESGSNSPLRERLLWEQATMARIIVDAGGPDQLGGLSGELHRSEGDDGLPFSDSEWMDHINWPATMDDVEELYERLILEFPQGFYAPYAREELQHLTRLSS